MVLSTRSRCRGWVFGATLTAACGDDEAGGEGDGSSGSSSGSSSESDPSVTPTSATTSTTDAPDPDSSTTDAPPDTTGEPETTGTPTAVDARLMYRVPLGRFFSTLRVQDVVDGVPGDFVEVMPGLDADHGVLTHRSLDDGRAVSYCVDQVASDENDCYVQDLSTTPLGAPQQTDVAPVPPTSITSVPDFTVPGALLFRTVDPIGPMRRMYRVPWADAMLGAPSVVLEPSEGMTAFGDFGISPDSQWLTVVARIDDGPSNVYVASSTGEAESGTQVSAVVDPAAEAAVEAWLSDSSGLVFSVDDDGLGFQKDAPYLATLEAGLPTDVVRIDDPLQDALEVARPAVAPDDRAVVYWVGTGLAGDAMYVALEAGVPEAPVLLSTLGPQQTIPIDLGWSPDARWVLYLAEHAAAETRDVFLVDTTGPGLSEPFQVTALPDGSSPEAQMFDAASHWLYVVAPDGPQSRSLIRVDVSGAQPGAPQTLYEVQAQGIGPSGELRFSHDGDTLLFTATDADDGPLELWGVDVSGAEPGAAFRVNAPLAAGERVTYGARISPDDTAVAYRVGGEDPESPTRLMLAALASPGVAIEVAEDASSHDFVLLR